MCFQYNCTVDSGKSNLNGSSKNGVISILFLLLHFQLKIVCIGLNGIVETSFKGMCNPEMKAEGRMTEHLTPSAGRIFYDYDILNALTDKSYSSANELGNDRPGQMVYNSMGQRISMEDITGESTYTYDSLSRLNTATNGSGKTVEYVYDEANNLSSILYPDGYSVLYEYDKNDNITKLTDRDGRETVYGYDLLNRLTKVVRPDGSQSEYTYNARNQVLEAKNTCVCGILISDYQYTYNDASLVTKEVAKEDLFTSSKDHGYNGGEKGKCAHADGSGGGGSDLWWNGWDSQNPWQNQNPEWETTVQSARSLMMQMAT